MQERADKIIKAVYKKWKEANPAADAHPDEEVLACFLENKLSKEEAERVREHLIACDACAGIIAVQMGSETGETHDAPSELLQRVKNLVSQEDKASLLEIFLKLKEKALEILSTTGDVLVGQELVPAPVLRSRKIRDFKDEINILKDFGDIRVEVRIENKNGQEFSLTIAIKEKATQKLLKDLRVTLVKEDTELESYLADTGRVTFEHVLLGVYKVEISSVENKLASILLDIKS